MADPTPTPAPAVSPTGQPLVPAAWVPYILLVQVVSMGAAGVLAAVLGPSHWSALVAGAVAAAALTLLGAGPGLRRAAVVLLVAGSLSLTGCSFFKHVGKRTLDCAEPAIVAQVNATMPVVFDALLKPTADWSQALDKLVLNAGAVGVCAVKAVVAELQAKPIAAPPSNAATASYLVQDNADLQLARAQRWLEANGLK